MEQLKELDVVLRDYIKPITSPIAVKLLPKGGAVPPKFKRPSEAFGHPLALCQGFGLARKYGWSMAYQLEDMACGPSLSFFGFMEVPEWQKEGELAYPPYAKTKEIGVLSENAIDKLPFGQIETILLAPLNRTEFEPDLILIYANTAQIARMVQGALYCEGGAIKPSFAGRAACTSDIITTYKTQAYNLIVPDGGERMFGMPGDDEMVFATPIGKIGNLMEGIVTTHKSGVARYPYPHFGLRVRPEYPEKYEAMVVMAKEGKKS